MAQHLTFKDPAYEEKLFRRRLLAAAGVLIVLTVLLIAGLARLQILEHAHFKTLSQENRVKIVPIAPTRGLIISRDGVVLAENRPSFSLEVTPERVVDMEAQLAAVDQVLTLTEDDLERFTAALKSKRRFESIPLKTNLSHEEVAKFSVDQYRFPGFEIKASLSRYYPLGADFAHVVGYVARIDESEYELLDRSNYSGTTHIGKIGVEKAYESVLHGTVGYQQVEVNALGRVIRVLERKPPVAGRDLYLTLDASLQEAAIDALGDNSGAIIALDPLTGGVLAMVSKPGYDPNLFVNGISSANYSALQNSPGRPLFNRVLQGQYPPGSTIKPILALAGLRYGVRKIDDEIWCRGWYQLPGDSHRYRDWKKQGHGHVDMRTAIAQSCDVYFYRLAQDLGIERMHSFMGRFGFGRRTGIDLPGEAGGLMPSPEWKRKSRNQPWYRGETLITGIGQGFTLATPVQLAAATAVLARRGTFIQPRVAGEIEDSVTHEAQVLESQETAVWPEIPNEQWEQIAEFMEGVVHGAHGTARRVGSGAAYRFAGKTGTAQLFGIKQDEEIDNEDVERHLRDHALFIAFAPVDDPVIALAVVVENGGSGSRAAAPIARRLFDEYLGTTLTNRSP